MGVLLLIVALSSVGAIYLLWKHFSKKIKELNEEIQSMKLQIKLDRFETQSPPKFKQGDKVGVLVITTYVNKYDDHRVECYRKYTCFNEKHSIIKEFEEGELLHFQADLEKSTSLPKND